MTPEAMAELHAAAFAGQGRGWSAEEFAALIGSEHVFALGDARAFALCRGGAGEGEVLTIATDPALRRQGYARRLLGGLEAEAARRGARRLFLEVAADNAAARGLYAGAGYAEIGRRAGYYARDKGAARVDALVLEKDNIV